MTTKGEALASWMTYYTTVADVGYSQPNRQSINALTTPIPGAVAEADCSSSTLAAARRAGLPTGYATYTGDMRAGLAAVGWAVIPYAQTGGDADNLYPGDLLLSEAASGGVGHVAAYIGNDTVAELWIDGQGDIMGSAEGDGAGDDTGGESRVVGFYAHPYTVRGLWTHVLRPPAEAADDTTSTTSGAAPAHAAITTDLIGDDMYIICTRTPWGEWAYALIHATVGGARAIDNTYGERAAYERLLGEAKVVEWDFYNLHVRQAWERHNAAVAAIRGGVREDVDAAAQRVIDATKKEA
jgi:hypothetical protein